MSNSVQVHIHAAPYSPDIPPTIIMGFAGAEFSQAVFLTAPTDPAEAARNADVLFKAYLEACAAATKDWQENSPDSNAA